jgi:hypothetical protein
LEYKRRIFCKYLFGTRRLLAILIISGTLTASNPGGQLLILQRFFSEDTVMGPILEKPSNPSRTLVLGLLVSCHFTKCVEDCPLRKIHNDLSMEEKHEYALGLSDEEVNNILVQREFCYEKRLSDLEQW